MNHQFRSALGGFDKKDVVSYLQDLDELHRSEVLSLKTELQHLKADYQAALSHITEQTTMIRELEDKLNTLSTAQEEEVSYRDAELEAYRRAEAAERISTEKADAVLSAAKEDAEQLLSKAKADADALVEKAHAEAGQLLQQAQIESERLLLDANTRSEAARNAAQAISQRLSETMSAIGELLNGTK